MTRATNTAPLTVVKPRAKDELWDRPKRTEGLPQGENQRIGEMLSYRRPHNSAGEWMFIERYIEPLNPEWIIEPLREKGEESMGETHAFVVRIPGTEEQNARAFCAHTDSVHNRTIELPRQAVGFDAVRREFFVNDPKQRDCLGADDAAGVYILLRMIEAGVPGMYVFFRGEERGGIGSSYVVEHRSDLFEGITQAIQFDRRSTESIITEMACGRTCSDDFANALGRALAMGHQTDDTGSFTDTANLAEIVPECTNISVGYDWEHSPNETLNTQYLLALADACIAAFKDPELVLPVMRKAGEFRAARDYSRRGFAFFDEYEVDVPGFGPVSAYDLPNMTEEQIYDMATLLTMEETAALLCGAANALLEAIPEYYDWQDMA